MRLFDVKSDVDLDFDVEILDFLNVFVEVSESFSKI